MEAASQLLYLYPELVFCLDSSMVEHAAVNRGVAGSSPARGARDSSRSAVFSFIRGCRQIKIQLLTAFNSAILCRLRKQSRLRGQAVKTSPFHGGNTGSIPVGVI